MVEGRTHKPVIEADLCAACNVCIRGCPAEFIPEYGKEETSLRGALYTGRLKGTSREERPILPPCRLACPLDLGTKDYAGLIAEGRFLEALDLIRKDLPFPGVIGRICHHPCEEACLRGKDLDEPVSLCTLKRFVADYEVDRREIPVPAPGQEKGKNIAIIGGGPSGMTCALALRQAGYHVTLFEEHDRLGGMLYWGVPAYRLPREVLGREVSIVEKAGVEVRYNTKVGRDITLREIRETFDAVYVGCGAQGGARLGLENEDAPGVLTGVEFLRRVNSHEPLKIGETVVVVGGGNVAIDAALSAKRLGAREVTLVCLEKRKEMAATDWEIAQAREEGVRIHNGWGPKRIILRDGKTAAIEFRRCRSVFDKEGCFNPTYNEQVTRTFKADGIIVAVGQAPEVDFLMAIDGLEITPGGWVKADPVTFETNIPAIFAGGDMVTGPGMAIEAVAAGKKAALAIDRYLSSSPSLLAGGRDRGAKEGEG